MPPNPGRPLCQSWHALDPPILPFLAPRVFSPWPPSCRRGYFAAQAITTRTRSGNEHRIYGIVGKWNSSRRFSTCPESEDEPHAVKELRRTRIRLTSKHYPRRPRSPQSPVGWNPLRIPDLERPFAPRSQPFDYASVLRFADRITDRSDVEIIDNLIKQESSGSLRTLWFTLPFDKRQNIWPNLLLAAMSRPLDALARVLDGTYLDTTRSKETTESVVGSIIEHFLGRGEPLKLEYLKKVYFLVIYVLQKWNVQRSSFRPYAIYLLLKNLESAQIKALYRHMHHATKSLSPGIQRHFVYRLCDLGETDLAFEILQTIRHQDSRFYRYWGYKSVFVRLLEMNGHISNTGLSDAQIFDFLLECGISPTPPMYEVLVKNSLHSGDSTNAWNVYRMMVGHGLEPSRTICSLLLNDSKVRMDHVAMAEIVGDIRKNKLKNAHVAADILHMIFLLSAKDDGTLSGGELPDSPTPFERMLPVYCNYFDPQPLSDIIRDFPARYGHLVRGDNIDSTSLMTPTTPILAVMLMAILKQSTPSSIVDQYRWFHHLVLEGHPAVSQFGRSTRVYNLFIEALGRFADTLDLCQGIIRDMIALSQEPIAQNPVPSSVHPAGQEAFANDSGRKDIQSSTSAPGSVCVQDSSGGPAPDWYTYAILLNAFLSHGDIPSAKNIMRLMETQSEKLNGVGWNNLVSGYARLQEPERAAEAYDRMKAAGFKMDNYTTRKLSGLRRYRRFIDIAQELERLREQDALPMDPEHSERSQRVEDTWSPLLDESEQFVLRSNNRKQPTSRPQRTRRPRTPSYPRVKHTSRDGHYSFEKSRQYSPERGPKRGPKPALLSPQHSIVYSAAI